MRTQPDSAVLLSALVHSAGSSKPFGELTREEVRARAAELRETAGWGPTARVAPVAMAWSELGRLMDREEAARVADLDSQAIAERAEALWIVPPGGSLLP